MTGLSPALKNAFEFFAGRTVSNRKLAAALLIAILGMPSVFIGPATRVNATPQNIHAPVSAPPEPFVVHNTWRFTTLATSWFSSLTARVASLAYPALPEGLGAARMPDLGEHVLGFIAPLFAFAKPLSSSSTTTTAPPPPQPSSVVDFDFDNDGKADIGRWHSANAEFKVKNSNGGSYSDFILGGSPSPGRIAPGDFNGDGKTDAAVFNGGTWTYKTSTGATAQTITWGTSGDIPVAGDYDGDGTTDAAVYRPSTNVWWVSKSGGGTIQTALGTT